MRGRGGLGWLSGERVHSLLVGRNEFWLGMPMGVGLCKYRPATAGRRVSVVQVVAKRALTSAVAPCGW
jgi:hypothetical protein